MTPLPISFIAHNWLLFILNRFSEKGEYKKLNTHHWTLIVQFSSFWFFLSVMPNSLWPHESQHTRPSCPSPAPEVHPNSCASSQWCHSAIILCRPLLLLPPIPPSIRVFPMSQLFTWGGQSIGVSASASVLPITTREVYYSTIQKKSKNFKD